MNISELKTSDGRIVCDRCVVADSPLRRMRGLLGRKELPSGEGILLKPSGSIHTFFMRFPIDVVFLDRDLRVLSVAAGVQPWKVRAAKGAKAVLELTAGESARRKLVVGDMLSLS
jgi:uncharacterized membrane protein (UPF0127 family)